MHRLTFARFGVMKERASTRKILCDFDQPAPPPTRGIWRVLRIVGVRPRYIRYDRTRHGWHVVIGLTMSLTGAELIAIQAILGSDYKREALNLMRLISMRVHPASTYWIERSNILFSSKLRH